MRSQQTDLHAAPVVRLWLIDARGVPQPGWRLFIGSARLPITQEGGRKYPGQQSHPLLGLPPLVPGRYLSPGPCLLVQAAVG